MVSCEDTLTKMQKITAIVLLAFLYYVPAIYKRTINNFKANTVHP